MKDGRYTTKAPALRGAALAELNRRKAANRKPTKERLHREQLAAQGALATYAPDRMTTDR